MDAGSIIREVRERTGLSQRALGERAGTSGPTVSLYESGDRIPRVDTLQRIVDASGAYLTIAVEFDDDAVNVRRNAEALEQLLGLADAMPRRRSRTLDAPILGRLDR